ncbi:MAG: hypothetical protein K0S47_1554 [Herbinix sp.]|nr:hypothetical protein [Herbinix sp.]
MLTQEKKEKNRRGRKYATIMLACVSFIVWLVILTIKYFFTESRGISFDFSGLLDGILDNLLGILPPIIIFNFAYEYFTQEYVSEEMSEQITQTLMSDPRAISRFDKEAKKKFVHTTLLSMLKEEQGNMVYEMIKPYIDSEYNIRKYYKYKFTLSEYPQNHKIFSGQKYYRVQEKLAYKKLYIASNKFSSNFKIGFFMEEIELDSALKNQTFLFREDLNIAVSELNQLTQLNDSQKRDFLINDMKLKVYIDNIEAAINFVQIDEKGILLDMLCQQTNTSEIMVEVGFQMPQLKTRGKIFASISEPTFSPNIELTYPDDKMKVIMIPFLNGSTSSQDAMHYEGICEILVQDEWIMPMSGVTFIIEMK